MVEARQNNQFLPESQVLTWASQLADALAYLHKQDPPILHRDIKPSNMKVTPDGLLKLVDFGLVKLMAPEDLTITILQGRGTALYTPLEQYGGDTGHTDVRSDVYAFGATLYHLLTGRSPIEARERFLNPGSQPTLQAINPNISLRTQRAVLWAMSLHPSDRPSDIETFRQVLLGDWNPSKIPGRVLPSPTITDVFSSTTERSLALIAIAMVLLSLIVTLIRT
jgi:serine/threonine-protein kinase